MRSRGAKRISSTVLPLAALLPSPDPHRLARDLRAMISVNKPKKDTRQSVILPDMQWRLGGIKNLLLVLSPCESRRFLAPQLSGGEPDRPAVIVSDNLDLEGADESAEYSP